MYENMVRVANGNGTAAWRADLGDYARWEYGRNAEAWLLATRSLPATTAVADIENRRR